MYEKEVYHFLVLHFPIALFVTGFIFNVFYLLNISSDFSEKIKEYIKWTMGMGIIWSFLSIITGFITALELEYMESIFDFINKPHAYIMILSTVIFSILFIMKNIDKKIFFVLHLCSIILLIYGTHIGAKWADRI
tara:strand:+ start:969 stop:1373 length:405 start_codon:yes stop_codon:yes gene_type:complete